MMDVVIDTSTLRFSEDRSDYQRLSDCIEIMKRVLRSHRLALDHECAIETEYRRRAIRPETFAYWWWEQMLYGPGEVKYVSGKLTAKDHRFAVRNGCDNDDFPFIAVAQRGNAHLVHEDSDYEMPAVAQLGVHASRTSAALAVIT